MESEEKVQIKSSQASKDVEQQKKKLDLDQDITSYFKERDISNRGNAGRIDDARNMSESEAEVKQMLYEASLEESKLPEGFQPMFNSLFLTARRNKIKTESGLVLTTALLGGNETDYQEIQTVLAAGPHVQQAFVGSEVCINFERLRMAKSDRLADRASDKESEIRVPITTIDGSDYIEISERDLKYILKSVPNPIEVEQCK